jgi:dienelactone hydrolase
MNRRRFLAALPPLAVASTTLGADEPVRPVADLPRELPTTGADLGTLFADVKRLAEAIKPTTRFPSDKFATWGEYKEAARKRVLELLHYRPEPVEAKVEVVEKVERPDHVREKILFWTTPWFRVPAYVLIPKGLTKPAPAIVDLHSHGGMFLFGKEKVIDLGANHPAMTEYHQRNYGGRPTATELVRRGYVVISIDTFGFGERRILVDADRKAGWDRAKYDLETVRLLNQQCRAKESTLVKGLTLAGATWPGVVAWDDMRTVDYLLTRPEVDPKRIGCVGISMGGYRAIYLTALDERIRAGCVVGFMSTVKPMIQAHLDTHSWVHFLPGLAGVLDLPDLAALAAPRALLVQQCKQDRLFPPQGMQDAVDRVAATYKAAGVAEAFTGTFYDEPHQFTKAMQDDAFAWFEKRLNG